MAGLKQSEKRLLLLFGVALFAVVNLLADNVFADRKKAARSAIESHKLKIIEYEGLLKTSDTWENRKSWLALAQPRFVSEEAAATEIESHVTGSAAAAGATIDSSKPTEPVFTPDYVQVAITVNVSGSDSDVTRFVSLLQGRGRFYAIPNIKFTTDRKDPSILRASLTVARWYSREPPASTPPLPATGVAGDPVSSVARQD